MDFQNDPELEKLFKEELDERSAALVDGAKAMAAGDLNSELSGRMLREGHTIKGTGRVMGYEGIARAGETCEFVWRWVQQGDLEPSSMLARTLEHLAEAIPDALAGGDEQISIAIDTVRALVTDDELVSKLPEPMVDVPDSLESGASEVGVAAEVHEITSHDADAAESDDDSVPLADVGSLNQEDMADVAATLDQIEHEVAAEAERVADAAADESAAEIQATEVPEVESEVALVAIEEPEPASSDVELVAEIDEVETVDEPDEETASQEFDNVAPLVFEPGPDGKLPTPVITYEIVTAAFGDNASPSPDASVGGGVEASSLDGPPNLMLVDSGGSILDPANATAYDLGGLLGAVEAWASEESVPINAGRLFRMINDVAALRIDLESAVGQTSHFLANGEAAAPGSAVEGALESLETVRRASVDLQAEALALTMMPLTGVTSTLPQLVKYLSKKIDRDVELLIEGADTAVDRQLVDRAGEVIRQLVVNAVAHGIEPTDQRVASGKAAHGSVRLSLSRNEQHLQIVVVDDGAGIDWTAVRDAALAKGLLEGDPTSEELRSILYSDGFSTNPGSSEFTGEGDGLARVTSIVEEVFGTMTLDSTAGRGTTFVVTMPAHRALQRAQIFSAAGRSWGIPESSVAGVIAIPDVSITVNENGSFISFEDQSVPYSSFSTVVGLDVEGLPSHVMVIQSPTGPIALAVDDVQDLHEVATKDLSPLLSGSSTVVTGVALLGGDETVMLVDAGRLAEAMRAVEVRPSGPVHTVLVVDDSQGVRQVVSGVLASHGFSTLAAGSVSDALAVLSKHTVDALVVDFSMPRADGVALIHMVRQRYGDIPVVMLSGVASEEDRSRAERAGAHAFFDKADFAKGALVEKLRELIEGESSNGSTVIAS